jgi:hypothetical protein
VARYGFLTSEGADIQTYQTVNFLLWLKTQNPLSGRRRGLCLLVIRNVSLRDAWLSQLNNDNMNEDDPDRCWEPNCGLTIWDGTHRKPSRSTKLNEFDVVLVTAYAFNSPTTWVTDYKWTTVIADEAHDFLRGQQGSKELTHTLKNWYLLQHSVTSMFIMTGTPFCTNVKYDAIKMVEAVAREDIRSKWGPEYTSEGLQVLVKGWVRRLEGQTDAVKEEQAVRAHAFAEALAPLTLRRDKTSRIRGQPVVVNWEEHCTFENVSLPSIPEEVQRREAIIQRMRPNQAVGRINARANEYHRCLSYSSRFQYWSKGLPASWWDQYDLSETQRHVRTKKLVEILREGQHTHNGVIIFVHRVFLAELCLKVIPTIVGIDARYLNCWD